MNRPGIPQPTKPSSLITIRRLARFVKPFWRQTTLSIFLATATTAANVGMLGTSAYLIAAAALQPSISELQVAIVGVRFFGIARGVFRYLERLVSHSVNFQILGEIRSWFYHVIEPLVPGGVEDLKSGDLLFRSIDDIENLEEFYVRGIAPPLAAGFVTLGVSLFTMRYSVVLAAMLALGLILTGLILTFLTSVFSRNLATDLAASQAKISSLMVETIDGSGEILMFGATNNQLTRIRMASQKSMSASASISRLHAASLAVGLLISNLTLLGILWLGIPLVRSGQIDGITLAMLTLIALASFEPVNLLPAASTKIESSLASARRLFEVNDRPVPVMEPEISQNPGKFTSLRITGLNFNYPGSNQPSLKNINLDMKPGKKIALVGPSGGGKTTLLRLIQHHLTAPSNTIYWNGLDANTITGEIVRKFQATLTQNAYLFSATILENMRLADSQVTEQQISAFFKNVGLKEWFNNQTNGFSSWLGDNGSLLSGGEHLRLLLTRALLMNRPILLLDEPFANLDLDSNKALLSCMFANVKNCAVIMATHRLVAMDSFDEILVINNAEIIQRGSHGSLSGVAGLYQTLWEQQQQYFEFDL